MNNGLHPWGKEVLSVWGIGRQELAGRWWCTRLWASLFDPAHNSHMDDLSSTVVPRDASRPQLFTALW